MIATLMLAAMMPTQAPPKPAIPPKPAVTAPAMGPTATKPTAEQLKAQRAADLKKQVEKKKADAANKARLRTNKAILTYQQQQAEAAYVAKMAPIWAKQQADAAKLAIDQQRANAMSSIANAAQKEAAIDASRLRVEARQAGYPQIGLQQVVP